MVALFDLSVPDPLHILVEARFKEMATASCARKTSVGEV